MPIPPLRCGNRSITTPSYLQDFHLAMTLSSRPDPTSSMNMVHTSGTPYPLSTYLSYTHLSPHHKAYTAQLTLLKEPTSFSQVVQHPQLREAIHHEIIALQATRTWSLVPFSSHKWPISCKWVYTIKLKADGIVERYKAWLVAKGYNQV